MNIGQRETLVCIQSCHRRPQLRSRNRSRQSWAGQWCPQPGRRGRPPPTPHNQRSRSAAAAPQPEPSPATSRPAVFSAVGMRWLLCHHIVVDIMSPTSPQSSQEFVCLAAGRPAGRAGGRTKFLVRTIETNVRSTSHSKFYQKATSKEIDVKPGFYRGECCGEVAAGVGTDLAGSCGSAQPLHLLPASSPDHRSPRRASGPDCQGDQCNLGRVSIPGL